MTKFSGTLEELIDFCASAEAGTILDLGGDSIRVRISLIAQLLFIVSSLQPLCYLTAPDRCMNSDVVLFALDSIELVFVASDGMNCVAGHK